jgi:hypothetical protein
VHRVRAYTSWKWISGYGSLEIGPQHLAINPGVIAALISNAQSVTQTDGVVLLLKVRFLPGVERAIVASRASGREVAAVTFRSSFKEVEAQLHSAGFETMAKTALPFLVLWPPYVAKKIAQTS